MDRMPCAVTADLDRHLAAQEKADARAEAIDNRAAELMAATRVYDPLCASNVQEAITEAPEPFWIDLVKAMDGAPDTVACLIRAESSNYWARVAEKAAEEDVDAGP